MDDQQRIDWVQENAARVMLVAEDDEDPAMRTIILHNRLRSLLDGCANK
jgi:hypothetical protein